MVSESAIRTAIVAKIREADDTAKVHRRWRYPAQNRLAEFANLFRDEQGKINGYMMRRIRRDPEMRGIPARLVSVSQIFAIRFYSQLIDNDDPAIASEENTQARIDALAAEFETDVQMGLGNTVFHAGLQMPLDLVDVILGDAAAHRADFRLEVTTANVEC
ncbi:MAG: hypothetical protein AABN33_18440 [Acidobacteriota bacterium]